MDDFIELVKTDPLGGEAGAARRSRLADDLDDTRSWVAPNGHRLSDRVWAGGRVMRAGIDDTLRTGIAEGWGPQQTAKALEGYLLDTDKGGYGARRLARTEITRAFGKATIDAAKANRFVEGVKWVVSGAHSGSDICDDHARRSSRGMEPGVYVPREAPRYPGHPQCRCHLQPVTAKDVDAVVAQLRQELGLGEPRE